MTQLRAKDARSNARASLVIFDEINCIMRCIIQRSNDGFLEATIEDGTTFTEATPTLNLAGTVSNPTNVVGETLIFDGSTVTLTGTTVDQAVTDINNAALPRVTASKTANNELQVTYTAPAASTWTFEIGEGTANARFGFLARTETLSNPPSVDYFQTHVGTREDRKKADELDQVTTHFRNLGYQVDILTNPNTNKTLKWKLYW